MQIEGIVLSLIWYMILLWLLLKHRGGFSNTILILLFTSKIVGTFALQGLFTYYYTERSTADIFRFFDDGLILNGLFFSNPADFFKIMFNTYSEHAGFDALYFEKMNSWIKPDDSAFYNDNHFMIKVNAMLAFISFGHYEVHGVIFSGLSFFGLKWCTEELLDDAESRSLALAVAVLIPSSLLWMSGGLKEAILIFGIGAFLKSKFIDFKANVKPILFGFSAFLVLYSVKIYFIAALIPAYLAQALGKKFSLANLTQIGLWFFFILSGVVSSGFFGFDLAEYVVRKQHDFLNHVQVISPGSAFEMAYLSEGYPSILASLPQAFAKVLVRPYPHEIGTMAETLMLLENIFVSVILVLALINIAQTRKLSKSQLWIALFILPIILLTGLVTPVFGAIMRYRAPAIVLMHIVMAPNLRAFFNQRKHQYT